MTISNTSIHSSHNGAQAVAAHSPEAVTPASRRSVGRRVVSDGKPFRGYTLDEIRYMKVVNTLKINLVQEQMKMTFSPEVTSEAQTVAGYMRYFDVAMRYADIAVMAFGMFRRMRGWLNKSQKKQK